MRPIRQSITGVATSAPIALDWYISPFNVGFGVAVTGTINYTVQHTFDNLFDPSLTPTWFNHPAANSQVANIDGNYAFPVTAIRLVGNSGTGTATITVIQAGAR